jgi:ribosome-binding factor A
VALKHTPMLHFLADGSYDEASHIDALLRRPEVARDLGARGPSTPDDSDED